MRVCKKCHVEILDETSVCPLCNSVLEVSGQEEWHNGYPDVKAVSKKLGFVVRLYSFLAIIIEASLYHQLSDLSWNLVVCHQRNYYSLFFHNFEIFLAEK